MLTCHPLVLQLCGLDKSLDYSETWVPHLEGGNMESPFHLSPNGNVRLKRDAVCTSAMVMTRKPLRMILVITVFWPQAWSVLLGEHHPPSASFLLLPNLPCSQDSTEIPPHHFPNLNNLLTSLSWAGTDGDICRIHLIFSQLMFLWHHFELFLKPFLVLSLSPPHHI